MYVYISMVYAHVSCICLYVHVTVCFSLPQLLTPSVTLLTFEQSTTFRILISYILFSRNCSIFPVLTFIIPELSSDLIISSVSNSWILPLSHNPLIQCLQSQEFTRVGRKHKQVQQARQNTARRYTNMVNQIDCVLSKGIHMPNFNIIGKPSKSVSRLNVPIHLFPYFHLLLSSKTSTFVELTLCFLHVCIQVASDRVEKNHTMRLTIYFRFTITLWGRQELWAAILPHFLEGFCSAVRGDNFILSPLHVSIYWDAFSCSNIHNEIYCEINL